MSVALAWSNIIDFTLKPNLNFKLFLCFLFCLSFIIIHKCYQTMVSNSQAMKLFRPWHWSNPDQNGSLSLIIEHAVTVSASLIILHIKQLVQQLLLWALFLMSPIPRSWIWVFHGIPIPSIEVLSHTYFFGSGLLVNQLSLQSREIVGVGIQALTERVWAVYIQPKAETGANPPSCWHRMFLRSNQSLGWPSPPVHWCVGGIQTW